MRIILSVFAITSILYSCKSTTNKVIAEPVQFDSSYKTAVFADADRKEKIKLAYAVIDSIYKKHAEENHFPAISFGLVVDGELVYKNSYGYTDIEKKTPVSTSSLVLPAWLY